MLYLPKVSIIIPVYNGSEYICQAINSALNQTYENIEIIVINDGSTDEGKTEQLVLSYGDRIKYIPKENGGVATALNLGIEKMTGDYFSWLSHDDLYKPDKIRSQIEVLRDLPDETILYSGYDFIDSKSRFIERIDHSKTYPCEKLNIGLFPVFRGLANGCTMLINKKHFERVGVFDPLLPTTQDYKLWFKMFKDAKIYYCADVNVQMRIHPQQGSRINPNHIEECNDLWIYMLKNISLLDMCKIAGTPFLFFDTTYKYLSTGPYDRAIAFCENKAMNEKQKWEKGSNQADELVSVLIRELEKVYADNYALQERLEKGTGFLDRIRTINCAKFIWHLRQSLRQEGLWKTVLKVKKLNRIFKNLCR